MSWNRQLTRFPVCSVNDVAFHPFVPSNVYSADNNGVVLHFDFNSASADSSRHTHEFVSESNLQVNTLARNTLPINCLDFMPSLRAVVFAGDTGAIWIEPDHIRH
eukprot:TRINITY_DN11642_c0_g1_i2.p1 TRINITY_DN11642_c0_g1~~TRINITY_DN11642_c0_g1_i2.p1  ORF type:complete len:105 (-),score=15.23 TRINITY_DN11642_c0_g1_i2:48-362(-)